MIIKQKFIDVFNGDADGICSLIQLRKVVPRDAQLITGVKRDNELLKRIPSSAACNAKITVLDISLEKNASDAARLLDNHASIEYFDHHKTGKLITHPNFKYDINLNADTCTSLIVDQCIGGKFRAWAIVGAFGDNLTVVARQLAKESGFSGQYVESLRELGILLNYNGYGEDLSDLYFPPSQLYEMLLPYGDPMSFVADNQNAISVLNGGYKSDMNNAFESQVVSYTNDTSVFELPNVAWARRVSGVFGNELANQYPEKAHAIIRKKTNGSYIVSIRAPLKYKQGADLVAAKFPTGGGRKAAAGINTLPERMLDDFIFEFENFYNEHLHVR